MKTALHRLLDIGLTNFRNYGRRDFRFPARVTALCGPNGTGKTNLLDAIHYLSFTKSAFSRPDAASVQRGSQGFRIQGTWESADQTIETACILRENGRKEFLIDRQPLPRFSDHIGRFPVVFIAPDDIALVNGAPEERRRFIDTVLSQVDTGYLQSLIRYNRILQERNSLLKELAREDRSSPDLLDVYDAQLTREGNLIFQARQAFLKDFLPLALEKCRQISGSDELISMVYTSQLSEAPMLTQLAESRKLDILMQRTRVGIHRDDLELRLSDMPLRQSASQGQRKSLLFALKLSEYDFIRQATGAAPLLLMDDIFEKLDGDRMLNLLQWVCHDSPGQVFLSDTHPERLLATLARADIKFDMIHI